MKEFRLVMPDYKNCIANLPNSILKKLGAEPVGDTLPLADRLLAHDRRNVVVLLLDGMGKAIIERHLRADGPFRSHLAGIYTSVFLSTTVAATTSVLSGLQPCEHCWLGWDCYYPSVDRNVTVFFNQIQGTDLQAAEYNVPQTVTPYVSVPERLRRSGKQAYMAAPFLPPYPETFEALCAQVQALCELPGRKYIYAYWNQPDGLMHRYGCSSREAHDALLDMERLVDALAARLPNTLLLVTADHGHIDTEYRVWQDYPALCDCLLRLPSLEPRVLNLFVREEKRAFFEQAFRAEFGDRFLLMPMEEAIEKALFGTGAHHREFRGMLGDYLAVATGDLSIYFTRERWKAMHGSLTEDEMLIPLIAFGV